MNLADADLHFPVLVYTDRFIEGRIRDAKFLQRSPGVDLRTRRLDGGAIVDATGRKYTILKVIPKERIWSLEALLWKGGLVRIDVELGSPVQMTLQGGKKELIDLFERTKWHRKGSPQWRSCAKDIQAADSFETLINLIDYFPPTNC